MIAWSYLACSNYNWFGPARAKRAFFSFIIKATNLSHLTSLTASCSTLLPFVRLPPVYLFHRLHFQTMIVTWTERSRIFPHIKHRIVISRDRIIFGSVAWLLTTNISKFSYGWFRFIPAVTIVYYDSIGCFTNNGTSSYAISAGNGALWNESKILVEKEEIFGKFERNTYRLPFCEVPSCASRHYAFFFVFWYGIGIAVAHVDDLVIVLTPMTAGTCSDSASDWALNKKKIFLRFVTKINFKS